MDNTENTTNVTEALPTMEPETRRNVKKWSAIALAGVAGLLFLDDRVRKLRDRKTVTVTVVDNPEPESTETD